MDIIAGASLAPPKVNLPLSVVKPAVAPGQFAARKRYRRNVSLKSGTTSSNPSSSSGESRANLTYRAENKEEIDGRLKADPWTRSGILSTERILRWNLRLGEVG